MSPASVITQATHGVLFRPGGLTDLAFMSLFADDFRTPSVCCCAPGEGHSREGGDKICSSGAHSPGKAARKPRQQRAVEAGRRPG